MKALGFRRSLATLALLTACSAASAALVTVDSGPLVTYSNQYNNVTLSPTSPSPYRDTRSNEDDWSDSALTITSDQASVTRGTATSTADSTSSGTLSGDTFTTASWARAYSDSTGTTGAKSDAVIDNTITFTVDLLSNYSWSALFDVVDESNDNRLSTDPYFNLLDASNNLIFGCGVGECVTGSLSGSGTLLAGTYVLAWGGSASATSTTGSPIGLAEFTQSGTLTLAPVPVPAAVWLFGSALGLVGVMRRRAKA